MDLIPAKLNMTTDIPVKVPDVLTLDQYLGGGRQPGEEELDVEAAGESQRRAVRYRSLMARSSQELWTRIQRGGIITTRVYGFPHHSVPEGLVGDGEQ